MGAAQHFDPALDAVRQRDFRRAVGVSVGLHVALLVVLVWGPSFSAVPPPSGVISVNLVSLPSPAAPKAASARPAPPAHRPRPAPVVLPKEPAPLPKPKPEAKARPAPEKPAPKPPEPPPERDYADVMKELRAETGEEAQPPPQAAEAPAAAPAGAPGAGGAPGEPVSPEVAAWIRAARAHIRQSWVVPPGFRNEALQTVVEVDLNASGDLLDDPRVVRASGNPWYDEGVVRSIRKASPLPPPPNAGHWTFIMVSDEML